MSKSFSFIHVADLHQGIDFSISKWKKGVKQRSDDFLDNFLIVIERSLKPDIDFLVVAGDIFNRSRPPQVIKQIIIDNFIKVAKIKPVLIIPGNHDKSNFNIGLLFIHQNLKIYNKPSFDFITIKGHSISINAIPFIRENKLETIKKAISSSNNSFVVDFRLLILHELVESCKVGTTNFQFEKYMRDVVPIELIEKKFDYVALGHVHKYQQIKAKNSIYYSGSLERTSVVEREEIKGYLLVKVHKIRQNELSIIPNFIPLPSRFIIYFKIPSFLEVSLEILKNNINEKLIKMFKPPLLVMKIHELDNYILYKEFKSFLRGLKQRKLIFDFTITSPNFKYKLKTIKESSN